VKIQLIARNIVNNKELDSFLLGLSQHTNKQEVNNWIKKQLRYYFQEKYNEVRLVKKYKDSDPDWLKDGVKNGTALEVVLDNEIRNKCIHVIDYFNSLIPFELDKIQKLSFEVAETKADLWLEKLNEKASLEEDPEGIKVVREYPEGFKWVKVFSEQSLNREGLLMKHCVGSYYEKVKHGHCVVYSLRNPDNIPKCTVEVIKTSVTQIKGFANGSIKEKYVKYVKNFIKTPIKGEKYEKVEDLDNIGIIEQEGIWHNIQHLPDNFIIDDFHEFKKFNIKKLPNIIILHQIKFTGCNIDEINGVKGDHLILKACKIKEIKGIVAVTSLSIYNCKPLMFKKGSKVTQYFAGDPSKIGNLEITSSVKTLLINFYKGKELPFTVPKKLHSLNLLHCPNLNSLPEVEVNQCFIKKCKNITSIPEGMKILQKLELKNSNVSSIYGSVNICNIMGNKSSLKVLRNIERCTIWNSPKSTDLEELSCDTLGWADLRIEENSLLAEKINCKTMELSLNNLTLFKLPSTAKIDSLTIVIPKNDTKYEEDFLKLNPFLHKNQLTIYIESAEFS